MAGGSHFNRVHLIPLCNVFEYVTFVGTVRPMWSKFDEHHSICMHVRTCAKVRWNESANRKSVS